MIIELTGIPGSGKSTILQVLKNNLKEEKYVFNIPEYILGFSSHIIIYDFFLLLYCFRLKFKDWKLLKIIVKLIFKSNNNLFIKINLVRNSYKKLVINQLLQNTDRVFFVDEGLSHIPLNIFVNENINLSNNDLKVFLQSLEIKNKILLIDANDKILLDRVLVRGQEGHRRMDFTDELKVKKFMEHSRRVLEYLKNHYEYILFLNEKKEINVDEIIKKLEII